MTACPSCATELPDNARFCLECGTSTASHSPAEYKQVTILFADVVHSMDIAAAEKNFNRLVRIAPDLRYLRLPSTSPAQTMRYADKLAVWRDAITARQ